MERIQLKGRARKGHGSASSRRARLDGWVPANIYGHGKANMSFYVRHDEIFRHITDEARLMTIDVGGQTDSGLVKELQFDAFGDQIIHVDFTRVSLDEIIETSVVVHVAGNAKGVASGGVLDVVHHEILVRGQAQNIPDTIEVDVTELGVGDAIRVKDLGLPEGIEALAGEDEPVVIVHDRVVEEEPTEEGEAPEETPGA